MGSRPSRFGSLGTHPPSWQCRSSSSGESLEAPGAFMEIQPPLTPWVPQGHPQDGVCGHSRAFPWPKATQGKVTQIQALAQHLFATTFPSVGAAQGNKAGEQILRSPLCPTGATAQTQGPPRGIKAPREIVLPINVAIILNRFFKDRTCGLSPLIINCVFRAFTHYFTS